MGKERRKRQVRTKTIFRQLIGHGTVNMLPAEDRVSIMECMISLTMNEVKRLKCDDAPVFVAECADMLLNHRFNDYYELLERCKHDMAASEKTPPSNRDFTII